MGTLIDDPLAFSHIARAGLQNEDVNLEDLAWEAPEDLQAETKNRKIVWQIRPLPVFRADRALLRMVPFNLIYGAVKFTDGRAHNPKSRLVAFPVRRTKL